MNDSFISKHDNYAYEGNMDRLTFSNQLKALQEYAYDLMGETVDEQGMDLINLRIDAKNEALRNIATEIERVAHRLLQIDKVTLADYWNTKPENMKGQYDTYRTR